MRKIIISPLAEGDLREIWLYISADNVAAADRLQKPIADKIRSLAEYPAVGHKRKDAHDKAMRFVTVYPYLLAYKFDDETLYVHRIISGYRDIRKLV